MLFKVTDDFLNSKSENYFSYLWIPWGLWTQFSPLFSLVFD